MSACVERAFSARLDCHYLVRPVDAACEGTLLVLALHGFGGDPEIMLELTARLFERPVVMAALEGPYRFFRDTAAGTVGYGWITSRRPAESIRLHHEMVSHVLEEAGREHRIPPARRVLAGFSQSVSLNYRFAATFPEAIGGVIGICGGVPSDWETGAYRKVRAAVLHIAREDDEHYAAAVTERYAERLKQRAADVEFHLIPGGHQMPSSGKRIVGPWVNRVWAGDRG